ncbi:30S ribosomal protein S8 [Candidatus Gottesmanbacteria bacterium RIFOXYB1_FULL_47_11]|uniref:Small ribosomal subunit protein uS8 n=1 Tax=Candidatus Gottesmanbacteria bacterium RIFOXYB1_FULL_47_11 TaxID=1798401 RepID=A0A1F6BE75_9BACT|nr:MAG: 30S ribosomal protein S8 [Candidatus Gottesmanbacteria bacterium RIFOXYB1_FULL_47_11]
MVQDPIGDMLAQIKNAALAKKSVIILPYSKLKMALGAILLKEEYISSVEKIGEEPKANLRVGIKYVGEVSAITDVKRVSKPGLRWYVNKGNIPQVVGGMGIAILSTPSGLMTGKEAKKRGTGGELLCKIW